MKSQEVPVPWAPTGWGSQMSPLHLSKVTIGRRKGGTTEALWECALIFFFALFAYYSLKDFHDIYEVAALKWKVGAFRGGTRPTVPWDGGEAGPALGWAPQHCREQVAPSQTCPSPCNVPP